MITIRHINEVDSTNSELRRMIAEGNATNLTVLTADYQTSGRGQVGNHWESEQGKNILMSILLQPESLDVREQYYLSMSISVSVVSCLREYLGDAVVVKWPNDIYVGDKKLAGILIENTLRGIDIANSIVGMGINVNQTTFTSDAPNPISMKDITGKDFDRAKIVEHMAHSLSVSLTRIDNKQYDTILNEYMQILYRNDGKLYPFSDKHGLFFARIDYVEPDGHIHLVDQQGTDRRYTFKEVEYQI